MKDNLMLALMVGLILVFFVLKGLSLAQSSDVVLLNRVTVEVIVGADSLYYAQCVEGCATFYAVAPINELYRGFALPYDAIDHWNRLYAAYSGTLFVPAPR